MKPKVFLTGGDGVGWALDDDLKLAQQALQDVIQPSSLKSCDIIHTLSWFGLKRIPEQFLEGKRIICHAPGEPLRYYHLPDYSPIAQKVGMWVAQSTQAKQQLTQIGAQNFLIPYTVDTTVFHPLPANTPKLSAWRTKWNIPTDKYIVGNFHRDSEQRDLTTPKLVKGPDIFVQMMRGLQEKGVPVHVLLAGPRRHWMRSRLDDLHIPYTYVGRIIDGDDLADNVLPQSALNVLYNLLDVYVISSRSEGGPRAALEAAAAQCKIISTPVGLAQDVLMPMCIYQTPPDGINLLMDDFHSHRLGDSTDAQYQAVLKHYQPSTAAALFRNLYDCVDAVAPYVGNGRFPPNQATVQQTYTRMLLSQKVSNTGTVKRVWRKWVRPVVQTTRQKWNSLQFNRRSSADTFTVCLWHKFVKPPYGGGNQFMLALREGLLAQGIHVVDNVLHPDVDVYVLNSIHFDVEQFTAYARQHQAKVIHRIDGPIYLIRGYDREKDELCYSLNDKFADATIIQSAWTFQRIIDTGYMPINPVIVNNAANPDIFHANGRIPFNPKRKTRLISTSWSNNPRKGGPDYKWIEEHLDWDRYEYTFVGRASESFDRIQQIDPVPSSALADILRQHDIYITASQKDPCSNALIEALSCGLPALYLNDGGHPELVGYGGLPFNTREEILPQLDKLRANYALYQNLITTQQLDDVTTIYLHLMRWAAQ